MRYMVEVREVHSQGYYVEADSPERAIEMIEDGEGDIQEAMFDYSHTLDSEDWTVCEDPEKEKA